MLSSFCFAPMSDDSDEMEAFTHKIRMLRSVSSDLKGLIDEQNSRLKGIGPKMGGAFSRLGGMIRRLSRSDNKRFRSWLYYSGATLMIIFLIFIFYILL